MAPKARRGHLRAVPMLILINALIFCYEELLTLPAKNQLIAWYGLSAGGLDRGYWWQFLTHGFLHGNIWHLVFNMAGLWFAGRIVERVYGTGKFLLLYLVAMAVGGAVQMMVTGGILIGASGAVCGVILAFTTLFPEAELLVLLFFVIPLRLRAKFLGWGVMGSSLLFMVLRFEPWIGHAAHFGGCLAGYGFAKLLRPRGPAFRRRSVLHDQAFRRPPVLPRQD